MAEGTIRDYGRVEGESIVLGTSLLSTYVLAKPPWAEFCEITMTANGLKFVLCPRIRKSWFFNGSTYSDVTATLEDNDLATHVGLDAMATSAFIYLGADVLFRGVNIRLDGSNFNDIASVMTGEYWNGSAWADLSVTDGTDSSGDTLKQSGLVTWTVPTTWAATAVNSVTLNYWMRISVSVILSATVDLEEAMLLYRNANYGEHNGTSPVPIAWNSDQVGGVELLATASTPTAHVKYQGAN
jgi:hypothetical protein